MTPTCSDCQRPLIDGGEGPHCRLCEALRNIGPATAILGSRAGRTTNETAQLRRDICDACDMALNALVAGIPPERVYDELWRRLERLRWAEKRREAA